MVLPLVRLDGLRGDADGLGGRGALALPKGPQRKYRGIFARRQRPPALSGRCFFGRKVNPRFVCV